MTYKNIQSMSLPIMDKKLTICNDNTIHCIIDYTINLVNKK